jgi:hypothetical protein
MCASHLGVLKGAFVTEMKREKPPRRTLCGGSGDVRMNITRVGMECGKVRMPVVGEGVMEGL